jgi:hypothetical protein
MTGAKSQALTHLQRRFAIWRRKRSRGMHIPADLWQAAIQAARKQGVWQTSQALGLDYDSLTQRLKGSPPAVAGSGSVEFVEIPGKALSARPGCVLELQDREGLRLRVELSDAAGAEGLAQSLWRGRG